MLQSVKLHVIITTIYYTACSLPIKEIDIKQKS